MLCGVGCVEYCEVWECTPHPHIALYTLTQHSTLSHRLTPLHPPLTFVLLPVGSHCQHLLHQLSVLWSELASEDGIPLGVMDSKGWERREGGERSGGREGEERGGRGGAYNS